MPTIRYDGLITRYFIYNIEIKDYFNLHLRYFYWKPFFSRVWSTLCLLIY
jgi:hypothetical protein